LSRRTRPEPRAPGQPLPPSVWLGLLTLYLVWGSTYLGIAVAIQSIPPFAMAASRYLLAGSILLALLALRRRPLRRPTAREWRDSLVVGALLAAGGNGLVSWGEQTVPSGIAALLVGLVPAWAALIGRLGFGDRLPRLVGFGIGIGFLGVAILAWPFGGALAFEPAGLAAVLVAPILWALGTVYAARRAHLPADGLLASALQMLLGGLVLVAIAAASGEIGGLDPSAISSTSLLALAYLTLAGSLLAYSTFAWLLRHAPVSTVATYAYVNPVVAVALGALVLGEPIEPRTLLAGAIIVVAVAIIVSARRPTVSQPTGRKEPREAGQPTEPDQAMEPGAPRKPDGEVPRREPTVGGRVGLSPEEPG
jgi:drug/metabolite transporter (DMT)-like permease